MESRPAQQAHGRTDPHAALHLAGSLGELDGQIMQHLLNRRPTNDAGSRQSFEQQVRHSLLASALAAGHAVVQHCISGCAELYVGRQCTVPGAHKQPWRIHGSTRQSGGPCKHAKQQPACVADLGLHLELAMQGVSCRPCWLPQVSRHAIPEGSGGRSLQVGRWESTVTALEENLMQATLQRGELDEQVSL